MGPERVYEGGLGHSGPPDGSAVLAELDRILRSQAFVRAERPSRFLRHLVERTVAGETRSITEHSLATEVFTRRISFDPTSDPIVRVEAGRLRRKLQEYYLTEGQQDPIIIELPHRTYVPVFAQRPVEVAPAAAAPSRWTFRPRVPWKVLLAGFILCAIAGTAGYVAHSTNPWRLTSTLRRGGSALPEGADSIAVLPFRDLSPKRDQEYFCDGLTEELTDTLTKVDGLKVVAFTSALRLKNTTEDIREIGKRLNVALVLEGTVRKDGDQLRIVAQLINAQNGYHLWAETYDRDLKDVLRVQQEIASGVVSANWTAFKGRSVPPLNRATVKPEAYESYLKGLYAAQQWTTESLTEAVSQFEKAISLEPGYADAYASLSQYYALLGVHAGLAPDEAMERARNAAQKAISLDGSLAHAHASLALVKGVYDWDWSAADEEFRRALDLDPTDPNIRQMHVMGYLVPLGRSDEALAEIQAARMHDPFSPRIESILGMIYYFRRDYDRAIEQFQIPLKLNPQFHAAALALGSAYEQKARFIQAMASLEEGRDAWRSGGMGSSMMGHAYALMGRKADADRVVRELIESSKTRYVSPAYVAAIYAGLGDKDKTMEWLEKAYTARSASLVLLKVNPRYDSVRSDRRFQDLLRRIHLQ